MTSVTMFT